MIAFDVILESLRKVQSDATVAYCPVCWRTLVRLGRRSELIWAGEGPCIQQIRFGTPEQVIEVIEQQRNQSSEMSEKDLPIATAPRNGRLIEVLFPDGKWDRVRWDHCGCWRREEDSHLRIDGGGCMPGEWHRIGRWRETSP